LDPHKTTNSTALILIQLLYDRLVEVMPDDTIVPGLATDWTISDDGLTYTFKLRSGVKFHDGSAFTSEDVQASIERIVDPATASPVKANFEIVESIDTPDDQTVVITLSVPYAPFLAQLASQNSAIVPSEAGDELGTEPDGTGSFKLSSWEINQEVDLVKNPDYWDEGKPYLDGITFTFLEDANARVAALQSRRIDFLYRMPEELVPVLQAESDIAVNGGAGTGSWYYWALNPHEGPTADVEVRQALYWAIDREQLVALCRPGAAWAHSSGFVPPDHWAGVTDEIYTYDAAKAKELLADAGYTDGFPIEIWVLTGRASYNCMAEALQAQLAQVGVDATIELHEIGDMTAATEHLRDGEFQSMMLGLVGTLDPDIRVQQTFVTGGGSNLMDFSDDEIDRLAAEAQATTDQGERGDLYRELQRRLAEVGPYAFLHNYGSFDAVLDDVKGYEWNHGLIYWALKDVWLDR
jgi:peptide/nickel transport system substrate-binding protein